MKNFIFTEIRDKSGKVVFSGDYSDPYLAARDLMKYEYDNCCLYCKSMHEEDDKFCSEQCAEDYNLNLEESEATGN